MTLTFDDDILLAVLGDALTPEPVEPGAPELAALHRALEIRPADTDDDDGVQLAPVIPMFTPSPRSVMWSRIHRLRHPVAAAVAVGILATSGVAAAGVATDRLPGPTRNVAYALGLPVTSPAARIGQGHHGSAGGRPGRPRSRPGPGLGHPAACPDGRTVAHRPGADPDVGDRPADRGLCLPGGRGQFPGRDGGCRPDVGR